MAYWVWSRTFDLFVRRCTPGALYTYGRLKLHCVDLATIEGSSSTQTETWQRLRHEVEVELEGKKPTLAQLSNLRFLRYCINECEHLPSQLL